MAVDGLSPLRVSQNALYSITIVNQNIPVPIGTGTTGGMVRIQYLAATTLGSGCSATAGTIYFNCNVDTTNKLITIYSQVSTIPASTNLVVLVHIVNTATRKYILFTF